MPRARPAVAPPTAETVLPAAESPGAEAEPTNPTAAPPYDRLARQFEVAALVRLPRPRPSQPGEEMSSPDPVVPASLEAAIPALAPPPVLAAAPAELSYAATIGPDEGARLPRSRPEAEEAILAALTPDPPEPPRFENLPFSGPTFTDAEEATCRAKLKTLGVSFEEAEPLDPGGVCFVARPVSVTGLGAGVAMKPAGVLNCPTALALAEWVQQSVVPAAKKEFGEAPASIAHASTYVCRSRYNTPGARVSEHAFAAAVDIASIRFEGRADYEVKRQASATERRFQAAIRGESCEHFTTVLGPGSNAAHETHLHLDTAKRRGGYRLCDLDPAPSVAEAPAAPLSGKDEDDAKTSRE